MRPPIIGWVPFDSDSKSARERKIMVGDTGFEPMS